MDKNYISKIGWGLGKCNMNCKHCYNSSTLNNSIPSYSIGELKLVADKICPYVQDINFGTGELACNDNAIFLCSYIKKNYPHIDISITTNGYTLSELSDTEIKYLFNDVDVSLDFPNKEQNNEFRGHPKAWEWSIKTLERLKVLQIPHTIVTCVNKITKIDDIAKLINISKEYNAYFRINWYRNVGRGKDLDLKITALEAWSIIEFLADKVLFLSLDSIFAAPLGLKSNKCPAGHLSARIHEDGSISPYPFLKGNKWTACNIFDESTNLKTIYKSDLFTFFRNRKLPNLCIECLYRNSCYGGCVTRSILNSGSIYEPDDYCPVKNGLLNLLPKIRSTIQMISLKNKLVHDGYLCTTIMQPI